ncbi:MAG: response regulator [Deltaproteobacteria bacterium]|nr:response regulator [Deltaproteobacteria bacterium]
MVFPKKKTNAPSSFFWHSIGRRFIIYIVLFSSLVTLFSTGVQLFFEYRRDLHDIHATLGLIEKSYLKSLSEALWTFNERGLDVQLHGILDLPDIRQVEIRKDGAPFLTAGAQVAGKAVRKEFPLRYPHRGQEMELGSLAVAAGLDGVYARLLDRVVVILATQAVKTFFVSAFIFTLFYYMVGRYLTAMADYAGSLNLGRLGSPLVLSRRSRSAEQDEIGLVVDAINRMRQTLLQELEVNRQAEKTVLMLSESAAGLTGQELFDTIVRNLCEFLGCECAILGRLSETGDTVTACAMVLDTKPVSGFSYALRGTPCADVSRKGYCVFPEQVTKLFPEDRDLATMGAEGYAAIPLIGRNKEPMGILCGISRSRLNPPPRTQDIMHILQARAVAELERIKEDEERERMAVMLRQAQKMEAIGTLAGGIAHDFNNILTPIIGYMEIAREEMTEEERSRWNVDEVLKAALRAKELVQQILTFSRRREQEYTTLSLQPIIKESMKLLRASLPATITINHDIDPHCGPVLADPTEIHQVIMNLCTNAFHAMEQTGGVLEVTLREEAMDNQHLPQGPLAAERYACLTVKDSGHGMDGTTRERIFEPYFTTKKLGKGTGLGLALVHGIVKAHHGRIEVHSEKGQGALFKVCLPVVPAGVPGDRQDGSFVALPRGTETILVVDDDESIMQLALKMLRRLGYTVQGLTDSKEAFRVFTESPDKYDLVITDQTMPGLTGGELAVRLMEIRPSLPVILCTGFSDQMSRERAMGLGMRAYMMKPLNLHDMAFKVRTVLDGGGKSEEGQWA